MNSLTEYFEDLLLQSGSIEMAEADFRQALVDDEELRKQYKTYCHEIGTSEKRGFRDYCEEFIAERNDALKLLNNDYDE